MRLSAAPATKTTDLLSVVGSYVCCCLCMCVCSLVYDVDLRSMPSDPSGTTWPTEIQVPCVECVGD